MRAGITGFGVVSSAGIGVDAFRDGLIRGGAGGTPVDRYDTADIRVPVAAQVPAPAREELLRRHGVGDGELASAFLWDAADQALAHAGLGDGDARRGLRVGIWVGTSGGDLALWERYHGARLAGRDDGPDPRLTGHGTLAERLARRLGARGPVVTVVTACCSSTGAIGLAREAVAEGEVDLALAGGADALSRFAHAGFDALRALSPSGIEPFGATRDGLQLGEGAAIVVVEPEPAIVRRGARVLAWVDGFGLAGDAHHLTAPRRDGGGVEDALRAAMAQAGIGPGDVDLVNAHATGTVFNDAMEAKAIDRLFGGRAEPVAVNAIKQPLGHALGAAGAMEVVMGVLALTEGLVPAARLRGEPDAEAPAGLVLGDARRGPSPRVFATINSAFAGNNAALVLTRVGAP